MADFAPDKFTFFSNFFQSKVEGKTDEYWAKAEWPVEEIRAFANWAIQDAEKVENLKGEECVVVAQKLIPRKAKTGTPFLMFVASDPKPKADSAPQKEELPF